MLTMFEQGIRGGISHISKRYAQANNKYMNDESKPSTFIQYLDANNLYGWVMTQKLPTGGFKWMNVDKPSVLKRLEKKDTNQGSYLRLILIILHHYGIHIMIIHLLQKKIKIDKIDKVICSFLPKKHYVVHYNNLKQLISKKE